MDDFFVKINERQFGPLNFDEIRKLITAGHITRKDLIWSDDKNDWTKAGSVPEFIHLFRRFDGQKDTFEKRVLALASGKGGVGKTVLAISLGVGLASAGQEVIMVDADFAGPDLHASMGIFEPKYSFFDFYTLQKDNLSDIVLETSVENLKFISGACGSFGLANPGYNHKRKFIRQLKKLNADYLIIDLGAGSSFDVIDFFLLADEPLLIVSPEPTSVYEAFGFIKMCVIRGLTRALKNHPEAKQVVQIKDVYFHRQIQRTVNELLEEVDHADSTALQLCHRVLECFQPKLILNMVTGQEDIKEGQAIQLAIKDLLCVDIEILGYIPFDLQVRESIMNASPLLLRGTKSEAAQGMAEMINAILHQDRNNST